MFAFKLAKSNSELYLGGTDTSLYTGTIEYHPVQTSSGFWKLSGASAVVGSSTPATGFQTIIDSGTTIMYGPPSAVAAFYAAIPGSAKYNGNSGMYSFPCKTPPTVGFSWGGKTWNVSNTKYV